MIVIYLILLSSNLPSAMAQTMDLRDSLSFSNSSDLSDVLKGFEDSHLYDKPVTNTPTGNNGERLLTTVKIPFSRSLQAANSSILHPRKVSTVPSDTIGDPPSYLGVIEGQQTGESILWNKQTQSYDFKLVERNGSSRGFRLVDPPANQCAKCHQNNGPIFPEFPWGGTEFDQSLNEALHGGKLSGTKEIQANSFRTPAFDESVRESNLVLQNKKVCETLCADTDKKCLADLLIQQIQSIQGTKVKPNDKFLGLITTALKKDDYSYISSVIPSINFNNTMEIKDGALVLSTKYSKEQTSMVNVISNLNRGFRSLDDPKDCSPQTVAKMSNEGRFGLEHTDFSTVGVVQMYCSNTSADSPVSPLYKRPKAPFSGLTKESIETRFPDILKSCFGIPADILKKLKKDRIEDLRAKLMQENCLTELFNGRMLNKAGFQDAISGRCKRNSATVNLPNSCSPNIEAPVATLQSIVNETNKIIQLPTLSAVERTQAINVFQKSCTVCHGKDAGIELDIDWSSIDSIKKYRTSSGLSPLDKIKSGEMPADHGINKPETELITRALSE